VADRFSPPEPHPASAEDGPYDPLVISAIWQGAKRINRALVDGFRLRKDEIPALSPRQALFWGVVGIAAFVAVIASLDELGVDSEIPGFVAGLGILYGLTWIDRRSARRGR
jgi:hypothetical protein